MHASKHYVWRYDRLASYFLWSFPKFTSMKQHSFAPILAINLNISKLPSTARTGHPYVHTCESELAERNLISNDIWLSRAVITFHSGWAAMKLLYQNWWKENQFPCPVSASDWNPTWNPENQRICIQLAISFEILNRNLQNPFTRHSLGLQNRFL